MPEGEAAGTLGQRHHPPDHFHHLQLATAYARADIVDALGISTSDWNWAIQQLKGQGEVVQTGVKRGARYTRAHRMQANGGQRA